MLYKHKMNPSAASFCFLIKKTCLFEFQKILITQYAKTLWLYTCLNKTGQNQEARKPHVCVT